MENFTAQQDVNDADCIYNTSVFSGFKRTIQSKNFRGGSINLLFGEVELDLSFADLTSPAVIDITQAFGAVKLYVPTDWQVIHQTTHFLSSINDKYFIAVSRNTNSEKVLVLRGLSILAEVKVKPARFNNA